MRSIIEEEEDRRERKISIGNEEVQIVQLAALIYTMDSFLRIGSIAARVSAETFEEFGYEGFQVGSSTFTRNNYNTRRGFMLADNLQNIIANTPLNRYINDANTLRELVTTLVREIEDGQTLD